MRFNFPQFNTEPAYLDLKVITAEIDNRAIWLPASQIASFIHSGIRLHAEWIGDKPLVGQIRTIQVATSHPRTGNIDFSGDAKWHRLPLCIENINVGIGNRATNRQRFGCIQYLTTVKCHCGGNDGSFGWAVSVDPAAVLGFRHRLPVDKMTGFSFFTADRD